MPQQRKVRILVPRLVDIDNLNAQNLNTKAFLRRFTNRDAEWLATFYDRPDAAVAANPSVTLTKLLPRRAWRWHMAARYLKRVDAIFYANKESYDEWGFWLRRWLRPRVPIILTLEGLTGTADRERQLSEWAGHPVACFSASDQQLAATDAIYGAADHIIAISPFLADMGRRLYGDKFSMIPLGVDLKLFKPSNGPEQPLCTVLAVGSVYERKRPAAFLDMAAAYPNARFRWLGDGKLRQSLIDSSRQRKITNVEFPGPRTPDEVAAEMQKADVFVLTSRAEGVPKVIQEAAACGLPVVLFGHYSAPSVVHGENGYVAWTDDEMQAYVGELLGSPELRRAMGRKSAEKSRDWNWEQLAPRWEEQILKLATS